MKQEGLNVSIIVETDRSVEIHHTLSFWVCLNISRIKMKKSRASILIIIIKVPFDFFSCLPGIPLWQNDSSLVCSPPSVWSQVMRARMAAWGPGGSPDNWGINWRVWESCPASWGFQTFFLQNEDFEPTPESVMLGLSRVEIDGGNGMGWSGWEGRVLKFLWENEG